MDVSGIARNVASTHDNDKLVMSVDNKVGVEWPLFTH
jgi:hypothetical protein